MEINDAPSNRHKPAMRKKKEVIFFMMAWLNSVDRAIACDEAPFIPDRQNKIRRRCVVFDEKFAIVYAYFYLT
jgi:hypothetical protein